MAEQVEIDHKEKELIRKICAHVIDWTLQFRRYTEKYYLLSILMVYYAMKTKKMKVKIVSGKNAFVFTVDNSIKRQATITNSLWLLYEDSSGKKFIIDPNCLYKTFIVNPIILHTDVQIINQEILDKFNLPLGRNKVVYKTGQVDPYQEIPLFGSLKKSMKFLQDNLETVDFTNYKAFLELL